MPGPVWSGSSGTPSSGGEPIEELVEACRRQAEEKPADGEAALRLSVWETTLQRIRKIEALMEKQKPGGPSPGA